MKHALAKMDADHSNSSTAGNGGFCAKREYSRGRSRPSPKSLTLRDTRQCGSNLGPFRASSRVQKRASGKRARSVPRSRLCSGQLPVCPSLENNLGSGQLSGESITWSEVRTLRITISLCFKPTRRDTRRRSAQLHQSPQPLDWWNRSDSTHSEHVRRSRALLQNVRRED